MSNHNQQMNKFWSIRRRQDFGTKYTSKKSMKKMLKKTRDKKAYDNVPLCQIAVNLEWKISDFATRFVNKKYLKNKKKKSERKK